MGMTEEEYKQFEAAVNELTLDTEFLKVCKMDYNSKDTRMYPVDTRETVQVNEILKELKIMKTQISDLRSVIVNQNIAIASLKDQINKLIMKAIDPDQDIITELSDRIDDLKSRIDLLDE